MHSNEPSHGPGPENGRRASESSVSGIARFGLSGFSALLGALTLGALFAVQTKYENDVEASKVLFRKECGQTVQGVADRVRNTFTEVYQGLRTIARLPGIRAIDRYANDFHEDSRSAANEVFSNLAANVSVSEISVSPLDLDPGAGDSNTDKPHSPALEFRSRRDGALGPDSEALASEHRLIKAQLGWFKEHTPRLQAGDGQYPVISGPEVLTSDTSRFSTKFPNDRDRSGLVFSVPLYSPQGDLKGCVSAVVLSSRLADLLPNSNFGIVNPAFRYARSRDALGEFEKSRNLSYQGQADPSAIFSAVVPVEALDQAERWSVWAKVPNEAFFHRKDYLAARQFRDAATMAVSGFALISFAFVGYVFKSRRALEEVNFGLESQVRERTATLLTARKMEAIGQLAAGVAHEVNTPTQFIGDNLRFLETAFGKYESCLSKVGNLIANEPGSPLAQEIDAALQDGNMARLRAEIPLAVDESLEGIGRITEIVRAMRDFAHPGVSDLVPVNLNQIVESSVSVARNEWKYVAEVEFNLQPSLPSLTCNPGEIGQLVVILVVNAAHAIKELDEPDRAGKICVKTVQSGDNLVLSVSDTGSGIEESIQERIFDQFFTTKEVGVGTGMGLAIAKNVVDRHGGEIDVESVVGQGTEFRVTFPLNTGLCAVEEDAA